MIVVEGIQKRFGPIHAVQDVSFSVSRGDVLAFLGPNGAGKSTTMKIITGFLTPDAGRVTFDGVDVVEQPKQVKSQLGYLPEGVPLYGEMPVHSFLEFIGSVRGLNRKSLIERMKDVVASVNLEQVLTQRIETLSKGYQRRVGLAQALLHQPQYLVLDEPTDGLDPNQKAQIRKLIRKISKDKVIILSTHQLEEVDAVCNRVIVINQGKIIVDSTPSEVAALAKNHNAIHLQLDGIDSGELSEELQSVAERVEIYNVGKKVLSIVTDNPNSIIFRINELSKEKNCQIQQIYIQRGNLTDVFHQLTQEG